MLFESFPRRPALARTSGPQILAAAGLALAVTVWGVNFLVVQAAIGRYPLVAFLVIRFALGACVLGLVSVARRQGVYGLGRGRMARLAGAGLALAVGYGFQTWGLAMGATPGVSAMLAGSVAVLAPAWQWLLWRRTPSRSLGISSALILGGTALAVLGPHGATSGGTQPALGSGLELLSAAAFGLQIVLTDGAASRRQATLETALQLAVVAGALALLLPWAGGLPIPGPSTLAAEAYSTVGATALAFTLQAAAQRYISAKSTAAILASEPVVTAIATSIAGEHGLSSVPSLGLLLLLGGALSAAAPKPSLGCPSVGSAGRQALAAAKARPPVHSAPKARRRRSWAGDAGATSTSPPGQATESPP